MCRRWGSACENNDVVLQQPYGVVVCGCYNNAVRSCAL